MMEQMNKTIKAVYTPAEAAEYLGISIDEFKRIEIELAPKKNKCNRLFIPYPVLLKIEKYLSSPPKPKKPRKKRKVFISSKVFSIEEAAEFLRITIPELKKLELELAPKNRRYNRLFYPEAILRKFKRHLEKKQK
jgi:hypothetical protein